MSEVSISLNPESPKPPRPKKTRPPKERPDGVTRERSQRRALVTSIVIFSLLYVALFCVWLFVLTDKILHGPAYGEHGAGAPKSGGPAPEGGLLAAAAALADPGSPESMTARHGSTAGDAEEGAS